MAVMLNDSEGITEECNKEIYGALHQTEAPKKLEQVPMSSTGNDHHISSDDKSVEFGLKQHENMSENEKEVESKPQLRMTLRSSKK